MDMSTLGAAISIMKKNMPTINPEDITEAVEDWLDDHPEATTTVQDGSITKAKLDNSLQETVDDVDELKSALNDLSNIQKSVSYAYQGEYIALNGSTADITSFVTSSGYECAVEECSEGDAFIISAGGQNATRAWAFVASDGTVLDVEQSNIRINNKVIVAPAGSKYLVSNNHITGAYSGESHIYKVDDAFAVSTNRVVNIPDECWENGTFSMTPTDYVYEINNAQNRIVCRFPVDIKLDSFLTAIPKESYKYRILFSTTAEILDRNETYLLCTALGTSDANTWYENIREINFSELNQVASSTSIYGVVVTIAKADNSNISASEGHDAITIVMGKNGLTKELLGAETDIQNIENNLDVISDLTSIKNVTYTYTLEAGAINSSGEDVSSGYQTTSCRTAGYIDVSDALTLAVSLTRANGATLPSGTSNFYTYIYYYNQSKNFISRQGGAGVTSITARIPDGTVYARLSFTYTKLTDVSASSLTGTEHIDGTPDIVDVVNRLNRISITVPQKGIVLGDSIAFGLYSYLDGTDRKNADDLYSNIDDTAAPIRISDWLAQYYGIPFVNIAKRGTGWVADTRSLGNAWVKAQATDFSNYDIVALCFGVNDYIQKSTLGTIADNTVGTVIGNMIHTLEKIYTDNPLAKVVVFSPLNTWGQYRDTQGATQTLYGDASTHYALGYDFSGTSYTLQALIDAMESVCDRYDVRHVVMSQGCTINVFNIKDILIDGLHPSIPSMKSIASDMYHEMMFR